MDLLLVRHASLPTLAGTNTRYLRDRTAVLSGKNLPISTKWNCGADFYHGLCREFRVWMILAAHNWTAKSNAQPFRVITIRMSRVPTQIAERVIRLVAVVVTCLKSGRTRTDESSEYERVNVEILPKAALPQHHALVANAGVSRSQGAGMNPVASGASAPAAERPHAAAIAYFIAWPVSYCFPSFHAVNCLT